MFVTTNNMYTGASRSQGPDGIEALFAPRVHRYGNNFAMRPTTMPDSWTTCEQAEALYPGEVSTDWIRRIYVHTSEHRHVHLGQMRATGHRQVEAVVRPDLFGEGGAP